MKFSKLSTLIASLILMTLATGCLPGTSAERVAVVEQALSKANETSAALDDKLDHLAAIVTDTREALADPNLGAPAAQRIADTLARAQVTIAELAPIKKKADSVLQGLEARLAEAQAEGPIDWAAELSLAGDALTATGGAVGGTPGLVLTLAGSLAGALGGLAGGIKKAKQAQARQVQAETEKQQVQTALTQTVKGIDKAAKAGAIQMDKFSEAMNAKQSHATKDLVDQIQGEAA